MRLPRNQQFTYSLVLMILCLGTLSGCRSGMFASRTAEWRRPDLSRMAFWRKEADEMPRPPAMHFDPTPATQTANQTKIAQQPADAVDPSPKKTSTEIDSAESKSPAMQANRSQAKALEDLSHLAENLKDKPTRAPYQVSSSVQPVQASNSTDPNRDFQVEKARNDFIAAMSGTASPSGQATKPLEASTDSGTASTETPARPTNPLFSPFPSASEDVQQIGQHTRDSSVDPQTVAAEMRNAQKEINQLKTELQQKSELSQRSLQPISPSTVPVTPGLNGSAGSNRDFQPLQPATNSAGSGGMTRVAQLDGNWPSSGANSPEGGLTKTFTPQPSAPNPLPSGNQASQFPSTNHRGGFSAANDPVKLDRPDPIQPVNLQREIDQVNGNASSSSFATGRVKNFSADIDLPAAVLQRQGSFAPGSLQPLKNLY